MKVTLSEHVSVTAEDVSDLAAKISNAVDGAPNSTIIVSCIMIAIVLQKPDIGAMELLDAIQGTSKFIVATITAGDTDNLEPKDIN